MPDFLKQLEVHNFKSYGGTQVIGPFKRFSCIVGPNGSGKSNLVDAISFVLGIRAPHLRGAQLKDLIHKGGEGPPATAGHVELVFTTEDGGRTKDIRFKRTVKDNGQSSYSIDGKTVSWEAYDKVLVSHSILVKAKNFLVFQGDVESVATKSPKALMEFFETVSGSDELKAEYERAKQAMEEAQENTLFQVRKKRGVAAEKRQFDKQKDEADDYEQLLDQQKSTLLEYSKWQLFHIDQDLKSGASSIAAGEKKLGKLQAQRMSIAGRVQDKAAACATQRKKLIMQERSIRKKRQLLEKKRPELLHVQEEIAHTEKRIAAGTRDLEEAKGELVQQTQTVKQLEKKLAALRKEERDFESHMDESMGVQMTPDQLAEYNKRKQDVIKETAAEHKRLEKLQREQDLDKEAVDALNNKVSELQGRKAQAEDKLAELARRVEKLEELKAVNEEKLADLDEEARELLTSGTKHSALKAKLQAEITTIQAQLRERRADNRESQREKRFRETLDSLMRLFPSVRGRLADLCEPRAYYELAVSVTLGRNLNAIVVDDEKTAKECIMYMKEQRLGTATFIPLDTISVKPVNEQLRQIEDSVKLVLDVIKFENSLRNAFVYACGNTVVCEDLSEAKSLAFGRPGQERLKVVTVDGVMIHKSGMMTGGLSSNMEARAKEWEQKDLEKLKKKRDSLVAEMAEVDRHLHTKNRQQKLEAQKAGVQTRLKFATVDLQLTEEKIATVKSELKSLAKGEEKTKQEVTKLEAQMAKRKEQNIDPLTATIHEVEARVFRGFSWGVEEVRDFEENHLRIVREQMAKSLYFTNEKAQLENRLEFEQGHDLADRVRTLEQALEEDSSHIEGIQSELAKVRAAVEELEANLEGEERTRSTIQAAVEATEAEASAQKRQLEVVIEAMASVRKQLDATEAQMEQLRGRRHALFQECKVEELWTDLTGSIEGDEGQGEIDMESQSDVASSLTSEGMRQEYQKDEEVEVDFRRLPSQLRNTKTEAEREKVHLRFKGELRNLSLKIEKIDPNMKARDRVKKAKDRLKDAEKDATAAGKAFQEAEKAFSRVRSKRIERFMAAFEPISQNITEIYKQLTSTPGLAESGGTAYLSLDNPKEPYLGGVRFDAMPPNKRFRDMDQLSGGEKTVAALALLFAAHSIQPAPFFLLDEIDAALDKHNIAKVARYIKRRALENGEEAIQFIVISLQDQFYENAEGLIGVMWDQAKQSSATLTLSLDDL